MYPLPSPPELSGVDCLFVRSASNIKPWMLGILIGLCLPFVPIVVQGSFLTLIIIIVAFIWLGISLQHYVSMKYAFLPEAAPRDIPAGQFADTLAQLDKTTDSLNYLGFDEIDRFYLKRAYNIIIIVYKHREKNIYWWLISFVGRLTYSEISSVFDNNLILNTVSLDTGHLPRPSNSYMQTLPNSDYENLLAAHQGSCEVLAEYGYLPHTIPCNTLRDNFRDIERTITAYIFTKFLWPLRMNLWMLLKAGHKYRKPLREQFRLATAQLPHRI